MFDPLPIAYALMFQFGPAFFMFVGGLAHTSARRRAWAWWGATALAYAGSVVANTHTVSLAQLRIRGRMSDLLPEPLDEPFRSPVVAGCAAVFLSTVVLQPIAITLLAVRSYRYTGGGLHHYLVAAWAVTFVCVMTGQVLIIRLLSVAGNIQGG